MDQKTGSKLNALKTGMYAREVLLPWESVAEFEAFRADIFNDYQPKGPIEKSIVANIVENRWLRERLLRTTAIATHRHAFGLALEESWRKILVGCVVIRARAQSRK